DTPHLYYSGTSLNTKILERDADDSFHYCFQPQRYAKLFSFSKIKQKKGVPKHFLVTPEVDDGRDEGSELPVYYHCRKERNRFFAALRMTASD
ncbi:MAG: hypothetical protein IKI67_07535, partial [Bacteroidales bacterium]|nr:hypothetical protein [Bacteroidales bacterium]